MRDSFIERDLFFFQLAYLFLISRDQYWIVGFHDSLEKLFRLAFDLKKIAANGVYFLLGVVAPYVPQIGKYLGSQKEHILDWLHFTQQRLKLTLQLVLADGFAVLAAFDTIFFTVAQIIGIQSISAARPAGRQGCTAAGAGDKATQRKIFIDILAYRGFGLSVQSRLYLLVGFETDQCFMVAFDQMDIPVWLVQITGI